MHRSQKAEWALVQFRCSLFLFSSLSLSNWALVPEFLVDCYTPVSKNVVQSSPLVWSTDVRSTRLYGQFFTGPNHRILILISNPDIRSARLYGQFSLDKTLTLQAGSTVQPSLFVL